MIKRPKKFQKGRKEAPQGVEFPDSRRQLAVQEIYKTPDYMSKMITKIGVNLLPPLLKNPQIKIDFSSPCDNGGN